MCHTFFIHSSVEGHLGCFQVPAITNNAAMNTDEQMSYYMNVDILGICLRVELLGLVVDWFPFSWRTAILISKMAVQVCTPTGSGGLFPSPHPFQHKLSLVFSILVIVSGLRWYLRVVLICISLIAKDVGHILKCLSSILDSSIENSLFISIIGLFGVLGTSFLSFLYILDISPLSDAGLVKIFSHSVGCPWSGQMCPFPYRSL